MSIFKPSDGTNERDPFNWKMPSRKDTMTLQGLREEKDLERVKTAQGVRTKRCQSNNMYCRDIQGTAPRVEIPKEVNRVNFYEIDDIERAKPRALHVSMNRGYQST